MKLTPKQKAFCQYYIETLNATESAIRAGYSEHTACAIGTENLRKPNIRLYIDEQMALKDNARIASAEEVLELLTQMARGEMQEETVSTYRDRSEIVKKQITPRDRARAAELLGKRYALFTEKHDISGDLGLHINVDYGDEHEDS